MTDWLSWGIGGSSAFAAAFSARSAKHSQKASEATLELERQRDAERRWEKLRPTFQAQLYPPPFDLAGSAPLARLTVQLTGPGLLADEFDDLKVWLLMRDSQVPVDLLRELSAEEQAQEHQFWSPWEFETAFERTRRETQEYALAPYAELTAWLRPTARITELADDAGWEERLYKEPLVIEIGAKLGDQRPWYTPYKLGWEHRTI